MARLLNNEPLMELGAKSGTYVLILQCATAARIEAGGLGVLELEPGWYAYVGSAFGPGGVRARCLRHWRGGRPHWHIDYLRPSCDLREIWFAYDAMRREHLWADLVGQARGACPPFSGFGATDCGCESHLFHSRQKFSLAAFKRRLPYGAYGGRRIHLWRAADHSP